MQNYHLSHILILALSKIRYLVKSHKPQAQNVYRLIYISGELWCRGHGAFNSQIIMSSLLFREIKIHA